MLLAALSPACLRPCRFLAVDRGVLRYPPYCVSRLRPVFASRQALLQYEEALALAGSVEQALEVSPGSTQRKLCGQY
jgi:hypothetical protein